MISYIRGTIKGKGKGFVVVLAGDLGYKVHIGERAGSALALSQAVEFHTYHNVREDASELYGFSEPENLRMFELLLAISGVGPKSALAVLNIAGLEDLVESISRGDPSLLTKVSGIGKKTAERIVLELRDKVAAESRSAPGRSGTGFAQAASDEIDALLSLGYSLQQAREALKQVDPGIKGRGERIKAALRSINS